jgi:RNA polymerase sigma factor (sigma-70 family)
VSAAEGSIWGRDADVALLFEHHRQSIFAYCRRRLDSDEDAEDALQATFVHALRSVRRGVRPRVESAWLIAIARNVCRERWRSSHRYGAPRRMRNVDELADDLAAPMPENDELFDLDAALGQLASRQRQALLLREWRGLSYAEIAQLLDVSEAAVETLLFRARRALAQKLEDGRHARGPWGTLGALVGLPRRLWQGGATAKLAAGTAAVSVAVVAGGAVPGMIDHHRTFVRRVPNQLPTVRAVVVHPLLAPIARRRSPVQDHVTHRAASTPARYTPGAAHAVPPAPTVTTAARSSPASAGNPPSMIPAPAPAPPAPPTTAAPSATNPALRLPSPPLPAPVTQVTNVVAPVAQTLAQPELPQTSGVGPVQPQTNLPTLPTLPALP